MKQWMVSALVVVAIAAQADERDAGPGAQMVMGPNSQPTAMVDSRTGWLWETLRRSGQAWRAWVRMEHEWTPDQPNLAYTMSLMEFDCAKVQLRSIQRATYDKDGQSIGGGQSETRFLDPVPGSVGAALLDSVCYVARKRGS